MLNLLACPKCGFSLVAVEGMLQCPCCGYIDSDRPAAPATTRENTSLPLMPAAQPDFLAEHSMALQLLHAFQSEPENLKVLEELRRLESLVAETKDALILHAREAGPMENEFVRVTVSAAPVKRVWNYRGLLADMSWLEQVPGVIEWTINEKVLMGTLKAQGIAIDQLSHAYTETKGTPAVRIVEKVQEAV